MPQQVPRLAAVFALGVLGLIVARTLLVPETFGDLGHYRAAAIDSIVAHPKKYAGHQACTMCHRPIAEVRAASKHSGVRCEVCHGPAAAHVANPLETKPTVSSGRGLCPLCHAYSPSRPTGFPQIDSVTHNPRLPCAGCHEPHAPEPPVTPRECSACHGQIASQLVVSHHAEVRCTTCHQAPAAHRENPRAARPTKPTERSFCGTCHATDATSPERIPRIDLRNHGQPYVCWQCHYPHYPEAR